MQAKGGFLGVNEIITTQLLKAMKWLVLNVQDKEQPLEQIFTLAMISNGSLTVAACQ